MISEQDDVLNGENSSFGTGHFTLKEAKQRVGELAIKLMIAEQLLKEAVEFMTDMLLEDEISEETNQEFLDLVVKKVLKNREDASKNI